MGYETPGDYICMLPDHRRCACELDAAAVAAAAVAPALAAVSVDRF